MLFDKESGEMKDIQFLINKTFPFVENLLEENGEFYPLATALKPDHSFPMVGAFDGDDFPLSTTVIDNLKAGLKAQSKENKAVVIFYDVRVTEPATLKKRDAVAVFAEHVEGQESYVFFYPYELLAGKLTFYECFAEAGEKEIFMD